METEGRHETIWAFFLRGWTARDSTAGISPHIPISQRDHSGFHPMPSCVELISLVAPNTER